MKNKPKTKKELKKMIRKHFEKGETDLNDIDTSEITDMSDLFRDVKCNFDISKWNTGNVKNMESMFRYCGEFDCNISEWDVSRVKIMQNMFWRCTKFNQDIGKWNTREVENAVCMFSYCSSFNQDLSKWNMRNLIWKRYMFYDCPIKNEWKPRYMNLYGEHEIENEE